MSKSHRGLSRWSGVLPRGRSGKLRLYFPILLVCASGPLLVATVPSETRAGASVHAEMQRQGVGGSSMWESHAGSLLVDYYEEFLRESDLDQFRERVIARYTEGTIGRALMSSPSVTARRAAVLALGVIGNFEHSNGVLGRALRDSDPTVRTMAEAALWAIWFRADSPENNQVLDEVRLLVGHRRLEAAVSQATRLIARAPNFAEAYNQRAIALFLQGRLAESAADCQRVLQLNPYHFGAVGGLVQCQLQLDQPHEALRSLRRALWLQPHNQSIREEIEVLEAQIESEGPR
jgi:tetratricopeptide (TPR) repeat protein